MRDQLLDRDRLALEPWSAGTFDRRPRVPDRRLLPPTGRLRRCALVLPAAFAVARGDRRRPRTSWPWRCSAPLADGGSCAALLVAAAVGAFWSRRLVAGAFLARRLLGWIAFLVSAALGRCLLRGACLAGVFLSPTGPRSWRLLLRRPSGSGFACSPGALAHGLPLPPPLRARPAALFSLGLLRAAGLPLAATGLRLLGGLGLRWRLRLLRHPRAAGAAFSRRPGGPCAGLRPRRAACLRGRRAAARPQLRRSRRFRRASWRALERPSRRLSAEASGRCARRLGEADLGGNRLLAGMAGHRARFRAGRARRPVAAGPAPSGRTDRALVALQDLPGAARRQDRRGWRAGRSSACRRPGRPRRGRCSPRPLPRAVRRDGARR